MKSDYFFDLRNTPYSPKREGVQVKLMKGKCCEMMFKKLEAGFTSDHSHPEEQMGYLFSGRIRLTIGDESKTCGPGESYYIPAGVRHVFEVSPNGEAEIVDVFSPPEDENVIDL
ncbi:MAG TPA: cupin domain-containing protein [Methanocella sp.]